MISEATQIEMVYQHNSNMNQSHCPGLDWFNWICQENHKYFSPTASRICKYSIRQNSFFLRHPVPKQYSGCGSLKVFKIVQDRASGYRQIQYIGIRSNLSFYLSVGRCKREYSNVRLKLPFPPLWSNVLST